ncbi:MAG: ABC transporter permease, partial [Magnetococcales bacterium]|nr:ABC transporter permease [Magnetococcales bacterium]
SLLIETLILGAVGSLLGLLLSFLLAKKMLNMGISTTGSTPLEGFVVPVSDLIWLLLFSMLLAVLGVAGPIWSQFRTGVADMLQPGFVSRKNLSVLPPIYEFSWLIPPVFGVSYLAARPFLFSSLSIVQFFIIELLIILFLVFTTLVLVKPVVWHLMRFGEWLFKPLFPLETMLTGSRIRQNSSKLLFSIAGIIMVFSMLLALYSIIHALQREMYGWTAKAVEPYGFYKRNSVAPTRSHEEFKRRLEREGIALFRFSDYLQNKIKIRVVHSEDINNWLERYNQPLLTPGKIIISSYLAAKYRVAVGDVLRIQGSDGPHLFSISMVDDSVGFFPVMGSFMDLKHFALVSEGNPLFKDNLEKSLGRWAVARNLDTAAHANPLHSDLLRRQIPAPEYVFSTTGDYLRWLPREIRNDLLIFDFILYMTVLLACMGVANTLLIQVYGRRRELAVLKTIGIGRRTTVQLIMVEGFIVGLVSAAFVAVMGSAIGSVSVRFLDRFTPINYTYDFAIGPQIGVTILILFCCGLSAIYPALAASRISSAESLHYE